MAGPSGIVALLTDFGLQDPYVGILKGVLLGIHPGARIVDLTHDVAPQDVRGAAFHLSNAYRYFPAGTVFACVVDPGVGGGRGIIAAEAEDRLFLAPDNGLLGFLQDSGKLTKIVRVENEALFLKPVSNTFHGRDIFAPVAAHLSRGADVGELGPVADRMERLSLPAPRAGRSGTLVGEVVSIDRFGNLVTNLSAHRIPQHRAVEVRVGRARIRGLSRTYTDAKRGALLALIGSSEHLEVSVNQGDAKKRTGARIGSRVEIRLK